ncbi:MAG: hypothetical protein U5K32_09195 [Bacteroidales bacterium]|nr:hypothetical protein [Bacteroidales bacterium]
MKQLFILILSLVVILVSCEKYPDKGTFDNPLLVYHGDAFVDLGLSLDQTQNGYVIAGMRTVIKRSESNIGGNIIDSAKQEMAVISTDDEGKLVWAYLNAAAAYDEARSIKTLADGSVICAGVAASPEETGRGNEMIITLLNAGGSVNWQKRYGGAGNQAAKDIIECDDGGFLVLGSSDKENIAGTFGQDNPQGRLNIYILKLNAMGDSLWSVSYGFDEDDTGIKVSKDLEGNGYMVLATTDKDGPGQSGRNIMFIRINSVGNVTRSETFGSTANEKAVDLILQDNAYIILGAGGPDANSYNEMYILKLAADIYASPLLEKRISINGRRLVLNSLCYHPEGFCIIAGAIGDALEEDMLFYFMNADGSEYAEPHIPAGQGSQVINDVIVDTQESIVSVGTNGTETNSLITFYKFKKPPQ